MTGQYLLSTEEQTREFGATLAACLRAGDLVILAGPLGAGKTVLAQGIGAGLKVVGPVVSPTFVIARVHRPAPGGQLSMVHVDAYRLGAAADPRAEVDDLDLDATLAESVTVVEWGESVVEHLTDAYLLVRIERRDDDVRVVTLSGSGDQWPARLAGLRLPVGCTRAGAGD